MCIGKQLNIGCLIKSIDYYFLTYLKHVDTITKLTHLQQEDPELELGLPWSGSTEDRVASTLQGRGWDTGRFRHSQRTRGGRNLRDWERWKSNSILTMLSWHHRGTPQRFNATGTVKSVFTLNAAGTTFSRSLIRMNLTGVYAVHFNLKTAQGFKTCKCFQCHSTPAPLFF